ncbi:hypothetical protein D3C72_2263270 [compost metagenome]
MAAQLPITNANFTSWQSSASSAAEKKAGWHPCEWQSTTSTSSPARTGRSYFRCPPLCSRILTGISRNAALAAFQTIQAPVSFGCAARAIAANSPIR